MKNRNSEYWRAVGRVHLAASKASHLPALSELRAAHRRDAERAFACARLEEFREENGGQRR